jgi:hypothetical protein
MVDPVKLAPAPPAHHNVSEIANDVGFPFAVWLGAGFYRTEIHVRNDGTASGQRILDLLKSLQQELYKRGENLEETITFRHFRKISEKATKLKPIRLKATFYMHPDYLKPWLLIDYE